MLSSKYGDQKIAINLKILIIGDVNTGKTSILNWFVNDQFNVYQKATVACEYSLKIINVKD